MNPASWLLVSFQLGALYLLVGRDYRDHPDEILTHEKMHLRHNHSVDLAIWNDPSATMVESCRVAVEKGVAGHTRVSGG